MMTLLYNKSELFCIFKHNILAFSLDINVFVAKKLKIDRQTTSRLINFENQLIV